MKLDPESLDLDSFDTTAASLGGLGVVIDTGHTAPTWCADCVPTENGTNA